MCTQHDIDSICNAECHLTHARTHTHNTFEMILAISKNFVHLFSLAYLPDFQMVASIFLDWLKLFLFASLPMFHIIRGNRLFSLCRFSPWPQRSPSPPEFPTVLGMLPGGGGSHASPCLRSSLIGLGWRERPAKRTSCWSGWSRPPAPRARLRQVYSGWFPRWHSSPGTGSASVEPGSVRRSNKTKHTRTKEEASLNRRLCSALPAWLDTVLSCCGCPLALPSVSGPSYSV